MCVVATTQDLALAFRPLAGNLRQRCLHLGPGNSGANPKGMCCQLAHGVPRDPEAQSESLVQGPLRYVDTLILRKRTHSGRDHLGKRPSYTWQARDHPGVRAKWRWAWTLTLTFHILGQIAWPVSLPKG